MCMSDQTLATGRARVGKGSGSRDQGCLWFGDSMQVTISLGSAPYIERLKTIVEKQRSDGLL